MKLRVAILAALIVILVAVLRFHLPAVSYLTGYTRPADVIRPPLPTDAFNPFRGDTSLTLEALRERALEPYRLSPDARFLLAVREVARLAGGPDSAVTSDFESGRWRVRCGSREIGALAELPDFPEMLDLLTEWARAQAWQRGWAEAGGPMRRNLQWALDRLDARGALIEADRAWSKGARDAVLFRYTTRAYTLLALATPDRVGTSDPIVACGLASLALARALGAEEPVREACLLA